MSMLDDRDQLLLDTMRLMEKRNEESRHGLEAAIRAAKLALFVINKQGVMPNDSWEAGFERDLKVAEDALAALPHL